MATLQEMTLYGLRNFAPCVENKQTIQFSSPLTLFLGDNGCGKTTLIEALKFACSGDVSGGSKYKQLFVYDPKLNNESSSIGEVQMGYLDAEEDKYIVVKTVEASSSVFTTRKATFVRVKPNGMCEEINDNICKDFGVSKEILNNVILCHQEDTAWPLDEPKKVKEKFDKIFGTVVYNKSIDIIREKIIVDRKSQINKLKLRVDKLQEQKKIIDEKQAKIEELQRNFVEYEDEVKEGNSKLEKTRARLQDISNTENEINKLEQQRAQKQTERKVIIQQQEEIRRNINKEYQKYDQELQNEIRLFQSHLEKLEGSYKTQQEKIKNQEEQKSQTSTLIEAKSSEMTKFQCKRESNEKNIEERDGLIGELSKTLNLQIPQQFQANDMVLDTVSKISKIVQGSRVSLQGLAHEFQKHEGQLQEEINRCQNKVVETKSRIDEKSKNMKEILNKENKIEDQLETLHCSDEQLQTLQTEIAEIDEDLKNLVSSFNADSAPIMIKNNKQRMSEYKEELVKLKEESRILQQNSNTEDKLKIQREEICKRKSEIDKFKATQFGNLRKICGEKIPEPGFFRNAVEKEKHVARARINNINGFISEKQKEQAIIDTETKAEQKKLQLLEKELQGIEQVFEVCNGKSYETISTELFETIEELQKTKGQYSSEKIIYEKFLQKFQSENPCCPVCQTDFVNKRGAVNQVINTIQQKLQNIPNNLERVAEQLQQKQKHYNKILQMKPESDRIEKLKIEVLPQTKSNLSNLENRRSKIVKDLEDLTEQLALPQELLDACNEVMVEAVVMDQHQLELDQSETKCNDLESQLIKVSSNRSVQQTESEIAELEDLQKAIQNSNDHCHELCVRKGKRVEEQLRLEQAIQGKPQLQIQLTELLQQKKIFENEIFDLQSELICFEGNLKKAQDDQHTVKSENETKLWETRNELDRNQKLLDDIKSKQTLVQEYIKEDIDGRYNTTVNEFDILKNKVIDLDNNISEIDKEVTKINKQLTNQKVDFRNLQDNLDLRRKLTQGKELSIGINELKHQIRNYNYNALLEEKRSLTQQRNKTQQLVDELRGTIKQLSKDIQERQDELDSPENREVRAAYKKAFIKHACTTKAIEDLNLYVKALEKGLIQFHKKRMVEINKIIRHLWRTIYRGNDLDYIEIRIDETETKELRWLYNYKVVQIKDGVELDMRNCGSTGQKALACLVIRMALAVAFSSTCGILVLDEPTTNLDRSNIISLSKALGRIVNSRQSEKKFQLLVITHNKEFLSVLKSKVDDVSHFWRVSRNEKGNSVVRKESF